jgi:tRNA threonylcarbamoyl adenosine modification protein YjeE
LGAGKTTLVRAVVHALHGSDDAVSSPTFVFRQTYPGTPPVEHIDFYRIENAAVELPELGLEDAFSPDRIAFIEWPERAEQWLPRARIELSIEGSVDGPRVVRQQRR